MQCDVRETKMKKNIYNLLTKQNQLDKKQTNELNKL